MRDPLGSYSPKVVCVFYASYAIYIDLITIAGLRVQDQPLPVYTLVIEVRVELFEEMIHRFLFGLEFMGPAFENEFDYQIMVVRSRRPTRDPN